MARDPIGSPLLCGQSFSVPDNIAGRIALAVKPPQLLPVQAR
jgi:hypothetical protein